MKIRPIHLSHILALIFLLGCGPKESPIILTVGKTPKSTNTSWFPTLHKALEKAREIRKTNKAPITINLEEGEHYLDSTLKITPDLHDVQIIGEGPEKTILKGSKRLDLAWEKYTDDIWVAPVTQGTDFDQLFLNGKKQIRARYPNYDETAGHWQGHSADAIAPERLKTWSNPTNAIVHAMHAGEWGDFHYTIAGIDTNGEAILKGGHQNNRPSALHQKYRMVENIFEELDSPGEWFLDKDAGKLYYWPQKSTDPKNAIFEGTFLKHLMEIKGAETDPVKNVLIKGLKLEHSLTTIMEVYEPLLRSDWTIYRGGAIFLEGTEDIAISDCEFENLGGNVIFVSNYNRNTLIKGNHIHDCGATAISFVGSPTAVRSPSFQYGEFVPQDQLDTLSGPANNTYPANGKVDDNLIYRIGRLEKQTAGIEISMAMHITASNNSIYEVPRAGINISEGTWGGHIIEFNDVFSTVLESGDHGSFNSWGRDRFWHPDRDTMDQMVLENPNMPLWDAIFPVILRNNRFRCDHGWDIDLDDGSSNYQIYNNVCLNGGLKLREGFHRTVENNIMINNGFHPHVWFKNSGDVFRKNIVMTDHKDIRLQGWGKEVDYNLFPDAEALAKAQNNGTDTHSTYGNPQFIGPETGNYTVTESSPALSLGFQNFPMDLFGVKSPSLKKRAKTPEIPELWLTSNNKGTDTGIRSWLGGQIKSVTSLAERSASGLDKTAGVLIVAMEDHSVLGASGLQVGDVIIEAEGKEINGTMDLMKVFQEHGWKGNLGVKVYRNQTGAPLTIALKK